MSRLTMLLASIALVGGSARADTFGGWQYMAPPGYAVDVAADHVALTKITGSTFCSIAVFEARALDGPVLTARAFEWYNVVAHQFDATVKRRATMQTKSGVEVAATTAALVDADGNEYAAVHYVIMPPGMIGSVLLTSSNAAALEACKPVATSVVGALAIDWSSPRFTDPEARVETPEGRWAVVGSTSREYTFSSGGAYRFHCETAGNRVSVIDETGKYTMLGNQLTLTPIVATHAVVEGGVARVSFRLPLDKTTYTWGKRYFAGTNEWQLVLTAKQATARDGNLPTDAGYRYSGSARPAWKFAPQPGA